jgi:hypothetical protein
VNSYRSCPATGAKHTLPQFAPGEDVCRGEYVGESMYFDDYYSAEVIKVDRRFKDTATEWTLRLRKLGEGSTPEVQQRNGEELGVMRERLEELLLKSREHRLCGLRVATDERTVTHTRSTASVALPNTWFGWIVACHCVSHSNMFLVSYGL